MWKPEYCATANRRGLRYPSDLGDAEWTLVEPLIPLALSMTDARVQSMSARSLDARRWLVTP